MSDSLPLTCLDPHPCHMRVSLYHHLSALHTISSGDVHNFDYTIHILFLSDAWKEELHDGVVGDPRPQPQYEVTFRERVTPSQVCLPVRKSSQLYTVFIILLQFACLGEVSD